MKTLLSFLHSLRHRRRPAMPTAPNSEHAMLVLSRRRNEAIVVNSNIRVVVVEIRGDCVRLGIEAPREASVHREETLSAPPSDAAASATPGHAAPAAAETLVFG